MAYSDTPLTPRHLAMKELGYYSGDQGYGEGQESRFFKALTPQQQQEVMALSGKVGGTNVTPTLAEPLHQYEKDALTGFSNTGTTAGTADLQSILGVLQQAMSGQGGFFGQAGSNITAGTAPVTMDEITARMNPFATGLKQTQSETVNRLRALAQAGEGVRGARSFGDTATGYRLGELDTAEVQGNRQIDYDAFNAALGQINEERGRNITGGQSFTGLGGQQASGLMGAANVAQGVRGNALEDITNRLYSGQYIRGYNQNINDQITNDLLASQGYDTANLADVIALLSNYGSNTSSGQTGGMTSGLTQAGGVGQALAGILKELGK